MIILTPEELHRAVRKVVADYEAFTARDPLPGTHEDAKGFTAHHAAARSALAHLEHLRKLHAGGEDAADETTGALMERARQSIRMAEQQDEGEEDDAAD